MSAISLGMMLGRSWVQLIRLEDGFFFPVVRDGLCLLSYGGTNQDPTGGNM